MKLSMGRVVTIVLGLLVVGGLVLAFMPQPVTADVGLVTRGPMRVTVDEDGRTRIRERYVVSSPLDGQVQRIRLRAGDEVKAGETVLTTLAPTDPALLDARAMAEAEARVRRAEAALRQARPMLEQARANLDFAERELARVRAAADRGAATQPELDAATFSYRTALEASNAAHFAEEIARFELDLAKAAVVRTRPETTVAEQVEHIEITAPIDGRVLRVFQESMTVVSSGTPLIEIGDPTDLEIEIDVLSTDAVRVRPGARVYFEHWGGAGVLEGRVRMIEPRAFTRISALGVEEQRVNVIADFVSPPEDRLSLGDGYRVEARIVVLEDGDVVQIPTSALFRHGQDWAVFVVSGGRASLRPVTVGRRTSLSAQILEGISAGERVVLHPDDQVRNGVRVKVRE